MTTQQVLIWTCGYFVELLAVVFFTRATARRVVGALVGGAAVGFLVIGAIKGGETLGWWHVPFRPEPGYLPLFYVGVIISSAPIYLVTWRVARKFSWRGLAVCAVGAAIIGPPRDHLVVSVFPGWMVFSPGPAPILADSATYFGIVALGHAVMRLVSGPSCEDPLARRPWEAPRA